MGTTNKIKSIKAYKCLKWPLKPPISTSKRRRNRRCARGEAFRISKSGRPGRASGAPPQARPAKSGHLSFSMSLDLCYYHMTPPSSTSPTTSPGFDSSSSLLLFLSLLLRN
ncbi:hypothetical protein QJS10_CPB17g00539 [Acorus calamus]|uniref:Uncharacterized protein n=1 Tax=Acorus calamus TaxID=4465 RepID=A0AAV9CXV6_ACOCL|nr:hypothetical protein QJS10_CPB17g00539 [Acorus calamus]